jgi:hypothetical protein
MSKGRDGHSYRRVSTANPCFNHVGDCMHASIKAAVKAAQHKQALAKYSSTVLQELLAIATPGSSCWAGTCTTATTALLDPARLIALSKAKVGP